MSSAEGDGVPASGPSVALREFELAIEGARAGLWHFDVDQIEPRPSDSVCLLLGVDPHAAGSDSQFWLERVHPDDLARARAVLQRVAEGAQESYQLEYRLRHADGSWRWVLDRGRGVSHAPERGALQRVGFVIEIEEPPRWRSLADQERRTLEREIIEIANREQERIGGDLHDGLGQDLTGIALLLRAIGAKLRRERSTACYEVDEVIALVNGAIQSTRALARGLSPVRAERDGLTAALQALATRVRERYRTPVALHIQATRPLPLDDASATHLYRICQEALTNAMRHSGASHVWIRLADLGRQVQLCVEDDGCGLQLPAALAAEGLGLKIMRYRAQMLGGDLTIESRAPGGAIVRCTCPLH